MAEDVLKQGARILEGRHMISIMIYLGENDGCKKTDLYGAISNNPRMPDKLDRLESCGLIRQEPAEGSRATRIFLTPMGSEISDILVEMDRMMPYQNT